MVSLSKNLQNNVNLLYFFIKADKSTDVFSLGTPKQTLTGQSYNAEGHVNCGGDVAFR